MVRALAFCIGCILAATALGDQISDLLRSKLAMPPQPNKFPTLEYSSATVRYVWTPMYDRFWIRWKLSQAVSGTWDIDGADVYDLILPYNDNDPTVSSNGTWTAAAPAEALGVSHKHNQTAGNWIQFTITGGSEIFVVLSKLSNAGYVYVTIDGSTNLVNALPYSPTTLTNRYIDGYGVLSYNQRIRIASGLSPGTTYTVRLTTSGTESNILSSGYRVYFEGFGTEALSYNSYRFDTIQNSAKSVKVIGYSGSANVYAISYKPTGASSFQWTGASHGNETNTVVSFLDGEGNSIAVNTNVLKQSSPMVVVETTNVTRHGQTTTTDHATVFSRLTFTGDGLQNYHRHIWLTAASVDLAYPSMWALRNDFVTRGHVAGDSTNIYNLTVNDGTWHGQKRSAVAAAWTTNAQWVCWLSASSVFGTQDYWREAQSSLFIEDRADGNINKIYLQQVGGTEGFTNATIAAGDVWHGTASYRISPQSLLPTMFP